ncbi:MAG: hypothetical protein ABIY62_01485 [Ginsengibacter sp.]
MGISRNRNLEIRRDKASWKILILYFRGKACPHLVDQFFFMHLPGHFYHVLKGLCMRNSPATVGVPANSRSIPPAAVGVPANSLPSSDANS